MAVPITEAQSESAPQQKGSVRLNCPRCSRSSVPPASAEKDVTGAKSTAGFCKASTCCARLTSSSLFKLEAGITP